MRLKVKIKYERIALFLVIGLHRSLDPSDDGRTNKRNALFTELRFGWMRVRMIDCFLFGNGLAIIHLLSSILDLNLKRFQSKATSCNIFFSPFDT